MAKLASRSEPALIQALSEGLTLIAEHVSALEATVQEAAARRARAATRVVSEEEAGKYLVLLDVVRCVRAPQGKRARQLKRASDHLAKGIYARAAEIRPADFAELLRYVNMLRQSHYLDGPNDVDWIFRNEVEARREEQLYVDFVETDDGDTWQSPRRWDDLGPEPPSDAVELVKALDLAGASTTAGLRVIADVWEGFSPDPTTKWGEVQRLSLETLERIAQASVGQTSESDHTRIARTLTFPLWHVDLGRIDVDVDELRRRQEDWYPEF